MAKKSRKSGPWLGSLLFRALPRAALESSHLSASIAEGVCNTQGDYTRERFVAKSEMKRFFHRQDAKFAKQTDGKSRF
jgi:hypothetical protein